MSTAVQFYATTVLVYAGVSIMACLGLNLQFGVAGIINFAFIAFQAVGAYTAAAVALGLHQLAVSSSTSVSVRIPFRSRS